MLLDTDAGALPAPDAPVASATAPAARRNRPIDWSNVAFLALVHVLGLAGIAWLALRFDWRTLVLALAWHLASSFSITGGYHRLFSHASFKASWPVRAFFLIFGAAAAQNSVLSWTSRHRRHHAYCDTDRDPYNARRGFWWSHLGWVLFREKEDYTNLPDLQRDPLVRWQHRLYLPLFIVFGFALPIAIAWSWGDPVGGLLVVVFLRLLVQYHCAFAINSLAHSLGRKPWSAKGTARDNFITALVTLGEGYHDYHHRFPADYRNGVRPWHFDPTKWLIWTLGRLRLAQGLRRTGTERLALARAAAAAARRR